MTIEQVQHLLLFLSVESGSGKYHPGSADGVNGPKTQKAVTAFQKDFTGLEVTGQADEATQRALRHAVVYGIPEKEVPDSGTEIWWDEIEYFTREEFKCKCSQYHAPYCDGYPAEMREDVVRLCDGARRHFGRPGHVISGLRCPQHNSDSGGVANSQHMYGEAVDLMLEGIRGDTLRNWFLAQPGVRYAYVIQGSNNVHVDIPRGAT